MMMDEKASFLVAKTPNIVSDVVEKTSTRRRSRILWVVVEKITTRRREGVGVEKK